MNNKEKELRHIVEIVVECCATCTGDGTMSVTVDMVLGKSRTENLVLTRCILARMIIFAGYTVSTISTLLKRHPKSVRDMLKMGQVLYNTKRAYRIAENEAMERCKSEGIGT